MKYNYSIITCTLSCPSDVEGFFPTLEMINNEINKCNSNDSKFIIKSKHFKTDTVPTAEPDAQKTIDRQLIETSDILIVVFKNRFGRPTERYLSGCDEEISIMKSNHRDRFIHIYFPREHIVTHNDDIKEIRKIQKYKRKWAGLYAEYEDERDLGGKIRFAVSQDVQIYKSKKEEELQRKFKSLFHQMDSVMDSYEKPLYFKYLGDLMFTIDFDTALLAYSHSIMLDEIKGNQDGAMDTRRRRSELYAFYGKYDIANIEDRFITEHGV